MNEGWNWIGLVFALLAAIVVFHATIRFDVNEWSRDRRKQKEDNLRNLCPHVIVTQDGNISLQSTYVEGLAL